ncbi:MAG TPA: MMPL family transporter [Candidatus Limnocylindrales bacterium]|nr:MMPL family transporter [Candidatus Limnocylindrales bacterium]
MSAPSLNTFREVWMFGRWGLFVYHHRRLVALVAIVLATASIPLAVRASAALSSGGWLDPDSEAASVGDRLAGEFASGRSSLIVLYRAPDGTPADGAEFQQAVARSLAGLAADPRVAGIVDFATTHASRFVSRDGQSTYAVVELTLTDEQSVAATDELRSKIGIPPGATVQLTGYGPVTQDSAHQSEVDLQTAETVSLPLALLILLAVFASIVAAGMPLLVAGLAIPSALGAIYLAAQQTEMSIFVQSIATMLGLALAIDYSLFLVSRFREELARGRTVEQAVERAVATSGKAVAFSGTAVAIGLGGLLFLKAPALASMGLGGAIVVFFSVLYALTFLPAVLGMLGPRVNALSIGGLARRLRGGRPLERTHRWERMAHAVMRHPVLVFVPVLALLLGLGTPFLHIEQGVPGASIYPAGLESRDAYVALTEEFPAGETSPTTVLADVRGDPFSAANVRALTDYAARLAALPNVSQVESPFSGLRDPQSGQPLTADQVVGLWATPEAQRPAMLGALADAYVRGSTVRFDVVSALDPALPAATGMIPTIRSMPAGDGITTQVGGAAALGHDFLAALEARLPWVVGVVLGAMLVILFLLFGSVVLPVKAVVMTLLSISASFGALVWIFQDGHLHELLAFEPLGYTVAGNPIIMFCVLFGLSMDYEVLLLSRIQEAWRRTGDNTEAVAEGLARTAGVITGAALVMVTVFAAFALAQVITIKSIGVGMAIAVFVDATIIRVLLVPATMRLLGHWNWWAPGPLGRIADRVGFSHDEDQDEDKDDPAAVPSSPGPIAPAARSASG